MLSAFNYATIIPIARTQACLRIDNIDLDIDFYVVRDEHLSQNILVGRDIFVYPGVKAIVEAEGLKLIMHPEPLNVNMVESRSVESIVEGNIICRGLDPENKKRLTTLLNKYRNCISTKIDELGKTNVAEMKIELLSSDPVYRRPSRPDRRFYQIPVHLDSIEKTAFITPDGQYEFLRMPFGWANAPSVFQRAINTTLCGRSKVYNRGCVYRCHFNSG